MVFIKLYELTLRKSNQYYQKRIETQYARMLIKCSLKTVKRAKTQQNEKNAFSIFRRESLKNIQYKKLCKSKILAFPLQASKKIYV